MATAHDIIRDAAAELGELAVDTGLSDHDAQAMLRRLNRMLESWALDNLMVYALTTETLALSTGVASYSTTGLAAGRPIDVDSLYITASGTDYPVALTKDQEQYDLIPAKTTTGLPELCYYRASYPNGTFFFWPTPHTSLTATVKTRRVLSSALSLATTLSFPPGYERALVTNLAVECGSIFGGAVPPEVRALAKESLAAIKAENYVPITMRSSLLPTFPRPNIIVGG